MGTEVGQGATDRGDGDSAQDRNPGNEGGETGMDSDRILWSSTKTCSQTQAGWGQGSEGRREGGKERGKEEGGK